MVELLPLTFALHSRPQDQICGSQVSVTFGSPWHPASVIFERLHATVGDMLQATLNREPSNDIPAALDLTDTILSSAQFATCAAVHTTLGVLPGVLVFQRDTVLPILLIANENISARAGKHALMRTLARKISAATSRNTLLATKSSSSLISPTS